MDYRRGSNGWATFFEHWWFLLPLLILLAAGSLIPQFPHLLRRHADSISCGKQMVSILCVAQLWAQDHGSALPPSLVAISNELNTPKVLYCPADHLRKPVFDWAQFNEANCSYEVVTPAVRRGDTNTVYMRCKVHGHSGYADATVFDGKKRRSKKMF